MIVLGARGVHFDLRQNSATKTMVLLTRSEAFIDAQVHTKGSNKGFAWPHVAKTDALIEPRASVIAMLFYPVTSLD